MRLWKTGTALFFLFLFAAQGLPQTESGLSVEVNKLSDRAAVFKILGGNANIVALNSKKGIVVIDTDISPSFAALLRQKISEVFGHNDFAYIITPIPMGIIRTAIRCLPMLL